MGFLSCIWNQLAAGAVVHDRPQLGKNRFLVRGPKNSDAHLAVVEIQHGWEAPNAVPQSEVRTVIEFDAGDFEGVDELIGNFVHRSIQHHGRKTPPRGELDQHGLAGFQNFDFEVRFIDFNDWCHVCGVFFSYPIDRPN